LNQTIKYITHKLYGNKSLEPLVQAIETIMYYNYDICNPSNKPIQILNDLMQILIKHNIIPKDKLSEIKDYIMTLYNVEIEIDKYVCKKMNYRYYRRKR